MSLKLSSIFDDKIILKKQISYNKTKIIGYELYSFSTNNRLLNLQMIIIQKYVCQQ